MLGRRLSRDIQGQFAALFGFPLAIIGSFLVGAYDIFKAGGFFGSAVTSGGLFGTQPFSFLGIAVAIGTIIIVIAVIGLIIWAVVRARD
jgi:hypothetical protein